VTIEAPPVRVWEVLEDASRLPEWVPVVEQVAAHAQRERPGTVRRCHVTMGGKRGYIVERCLEAVPERTLRHAVEDDSLGFVRMFRDYSFALELEPRGDGATMVTCTTFYEPRTVVVRAMNALLMRRRFARVRADILGGLKRTVEQPAVAAAAPPLAAGGVARPAP
jgi:uncharacterized protein YndB with AHSA1/START domain